MHEKFVIFHIVRIVLSAAAAAHYRKKLTIKFDSNYMLFSDSRLEDLQCETLFTLMTFL